ncbi:hypothetical protein FNV43_RR02012 [Rhamnella rubrinervis]|uniref:ADP-ribosyl cyclase/cyclic ADP-ribose hydrolase n=1 Tax=Rhamnella rubrinervis TaxID=2594499 RepID=A0A8K0MTS3_9ROSA|nr:hypothetical protein FNV43_RR02012 [Rhamnella rubrinervis]
METNPSSSSSSSTRFDVFLSFRGEDTRNNFTGHLSLALRKIGLFNIFKDDIALAKGKGIGPELMKAIEDSQYAVVVLSENYATSSWCLKELAKIVECMGDSGRIRTIFYHVNPSHIRNVISSDVKKQEESSFWKALEEHAKSPSHSVYLESWRNALVKVANQSGYPVQSHTDEALFIKDLVAEISSKLGAPIRIIDGLFGMTSRLLDLDSYVLQSLSTNNVCFIGIHGMGGIGKTTLARAYYKKISHKFDGSSFLQNIREVCEKKANGVVSLQKKLLKGILEEDFKNIGHVDHGIDMIRSRFRHKKVLIVLDDVSKMDQLNGLAGEDNWFGSGSIILVTTREENILKIRRYTVYKAESLNPSEALQLFSSKAFGSIEPPMEYKELSKLVVEYTSYLPLALTVLGSLLGSKNTGEWESALRRLRNCPEKEIVEKLKISFDDLNEADQRIFLDIACFFNGFDKDDVIQILNSCGFEPIIGISNLINKSLLSINEVSPDTFNIKVPGCDPKYRIWMHDLLQEMGKEIVRKESDNELGRQSRIWDTDDLYHILENEEETNKVEAIVTRLVETKEYSFEALSSMKKLRLLKVDGLADPDGLDYSDGPELSYNLQYLDWTGFPFTKLSSSFPPRKLVQLKLGCSKLRQLWNNGIKTLFNLKVIDLSNSRSFTKFEDFKVVPNLEKLILDNCLEMLEIHPSIKHLKKLTLLSLKFCTNLEKLPEEINGLASLQTLKLVGCRNLRRLEAELLPSSLEMVYVDFCTSLTSFLDPLKPCHLQCSAHCLDCIGLVKCQDGKMTALASLTRFLQDPSKRRNGDFQFVVPQIYNELPSWFINQSPTASITIKLDPNWRNTELIGFAMVFWIQAKCSLDDYFYCKIRSPSSSENWETTVNAGVIGSRLFNHLFLLYSGCENVLKGMKQLQPPSWPDTLEFSFFNARNKQCSSCQLCGVRLVYEGDIEELKEITSKFNNDQKDVQSSQSQSSWREPQIRRPDLEDNLDRKVLVLFNLNLASMRGIKSQAMAVAASNSDHTLDITDIVLHSMVCQLYRRLNSA